MLRQSSGLCFRSLLTALSCVCVFDARYKTMALDERTRDYSISNTVSKLLRMFRCILGKNLDSCRF